MDFGVTKTLIEFLCIFNIDRQKHIYFYHKPPMLKKTFLLFLFNYCFLAASDKIYSAYSIEGNGVRTQFNLDGTTNVVFNYDFKVTVRNCAYNIYIRYPNKLNVAQGIPSYEWSYDGSRLLLSQTFPDAPPDEPLDHNSNPRITCNGYVFDGSLPVPDAISNPTLLWYLYASTCEIYEIQKSKSIRPPWSMEYDGLWLSGIKLPAIVEVSETPPYLLKSLAVINDGKSRFLKRENNKPAETDAPKPFNQGYTNAIITSRYTNHISGYSFPSVVRFQRYFPDFKSRTNNLPRTLLIEQEDVFIKNIEVPSESTFSVPKLKSRSLLIERRPATTVQNFSISYGVSTNGQWWFLEPPTLKLIVDQASMRSKTMETLEYQLGYRFKVFAIGIVMISVGVIFVGIMLKNKKGKNAK